MRHIIAWGLLIVTIGSIGLIMFFYLTNLDTTLILDGFLSHALL